MTTQINPLQSIDWRIYRKITRETFCRWPFLSREAQNERATNGPNKLGK